MRHIYLSPHLDDAVLSCGGAIHRQRAAGEPVRVITLFAGTFRGTCLSAFALEQHAYWGNPARSMALRRAEDAAALALLGAEGRHLDYLDAVYRADGDGQWLYPDEEALLGEVSPADPLAQASGRELAAHLSGLLPAGEQAVVYAPLGIGGHVDHRLVHRVAQQLEGLGHRLAFYEDFPYAERPEATTPVLAGLRDAGWDKEILPLGPEDVAAQVSAVACYRSQMFILFGGAEAMPNRVWAFALRQPGACLVTRIWRSPAS